ncbi:MAG: GNAT family N-acetyltransferase [Pseudomonadota bacterium]
MTPADLTFEAYRPEMAPKVVAMLQALGSADQPWGQFYEDRLQTGFASEEAVVVAEAKGVACGIGLILARPICSPGGRFGLALAAPLTDAAEAPPVDGSSPGSSTAPSTGPSTEPAMGPSMLERALWDTLAERGRELGFDGLHASVPDAFPAYGSYVEALGFARHDTLDCMALPTDAPARPAPPGLVAGRYLSAGEEDDEAVAALCNTALRNERHVPPTDAEGLRRLMAMPGARWFVAREVETGRIAAAAETNPSERAFHMVAVRRRFWGTGLAEHLLTVCMADLKEAGVDVADTLVRPENAASIALQIRMGGRKTGQRMILYRRTL